MTEAGGKWVNQQSINPGATAKKYFDSCHALSRVDVMSSLSAEVWIRAFYNEVRLHARLKFGSESHEAIGRAVCDLARNLLGESAE